MNIKSLTEMMINAGIEENEAKYEIKLLFEHFCNYTENDYIRGVELKSKDIELVKEKILDRLKTKTPIQYIIGKSWFMGEWFKVNPSVLIPRDETELLVRECIRIIKENSFKSVLDIGTGSGCIACTIAKQTEATVLGVDISTDALRVALDNVTALNINNKAVFRKSDIFSKVRPEEKFDLIVSNPPYIPYGTKLSQEVMHEPKLALLANDNGIEFYKKIIAQAHNFLKPNGYLLFELGIDESCQVKKLLKEKFLQINILKDLAEIDRVIIAKLK